MEIFETIFSTIGLNIGTFLLAVGAALLLGIICSTILSFRVRTSKRFFVAMSILPAVVAMVISLLSTSYSITAGVVTLAVALGLVRFRSANGNAEEMVVVFIVTAIGLGCGLGLFSFLDCFEYGVDNNISEYTVNNAHNH